MAKKRKHPKPPWRPTKYKPEFSDKAFKQCLAGATDEDLADFFRVQRSTISLWKQRHPDFSDALSRGKEEAHGEIANVLFEVAKSGDVQAIKYFLNNRRHRHWRNDPEVSIEVNNNTLQLPAEIIAKANEARRARQLHEAKEQPQIEAGRSGD